MCCRIELSRTRKEDTEFCINIWSDEIMGKFLSDASQEFSEEYYSNWKETIEVFEGCYYFVSKLLNTNVLIGTCSAVPNKDNSIWDIGYTIHKDYWRQGYGHEMLLLLIKFCSNNGAKFITASVAKDNTSSNKLIQKLGFYIVEESGFRKYKSDIYIPNYIYKLEL